MFENLVAYLACASYKYNYNNIYKSYTKRQELFHYFHRQIQMWFIKLILRDCLGLEVLKARSYPMGYHYVRFYVFYYLKKCILCPRMKNVFYYISMKIHRVLMYLLRLLLSGVITGLGSLDVSTWTIFSFWLLSLSDVWTGVCSVWLVVVAATTDAKAILFFITRYQTMKNSNIHDIFRVG